MFGILLSLAKFLGKFVLVLLCIGVLLLIKQYIKYTKVMKRINEEKEKHPDYITILPSSTNFISGYFGGFGEYIKDFTELTDRIHDVSAFLL